MIKKTRSFFLLSLCLLAGCIQTWVKPINKTYAVRHESGVDYTGRMMLARGKELAPLIEASYSSQTSGWRGFALLEKGNILFFISMGNSVTESRERLLVSVNGATPLDITEYVLDWAWRQQDYEDKTLSIGLGPLKIEDEQLRVGLFCLKDVSAKVNPTTSIPLNVVFEFIAKADPSFKASRT